jgi:hypothetical protein
MGAFFNGRGVGAGVVGRPSFGRVKKGKKACYQQKEEEFN